MTCIVLMTFLLVSVVLSVLTSLFGIENEATFVTLTDIFYPFSDC